MAKKRVKKRPLSGGIKRGIKSAKGIKRTAAGKKRSAAKRPLSRRRALKNSKPRRRIVRRAGRHLAAPSPAVMGSPAFQAGFHQTYTEGYQIGFGQGYEEGLQFAYETQPAS